AGLLKRGSLVESVSVMKAFIAEFPNDSLAPSAYLLTSQGLNGLQRYSEAEEQAREGYEKFPNSKQANQLLYSRGLASMSLNRKDEACAIFAQLIALKPNEHLTKLAGSARYKGGCL